MAEDVAAAPAAGVEPAARPAMERAERERHSAYYSRFTLAYTLLAMVAATAVAVLVVVLARPSGARAEHWSTFVPTGSPVAKARQIATQVSSEYKLPTGRKLVTVVASPLQTTRFLQSTSGQVSVEVPISTLAIEADASTGKHEEGDFTASTPDSTVAYQMCGFGEASRTAGSCPCRVGEPRPAAPPRGARARPLHPEVRPRDERGDHVPPAACPAASAGRGQCSSRGRT